MRSANIQESLNLLRAIGLPVSAVLDVGVQHGTPALMSVFSDVTHHLFEPVSEYFGKIRENYNGIQFNLVPVAVSESDSESFLQSVSKTDSGEVSHSWISAVETSSTRRVSTVRLDSYCKSQELKGPLLLKIDVEGADVPSAILRGATDTLKSCSAVVIEMTVEKWFDRAKILEEAGFILWDLTALSYYGECLWQFDAIYVSRESMRSLPALRPIHQPPFSMARWQQG